MAAVKGDGQILPPPPGSLVEECNRLQTDSEKLQDVVQQWKGEAEATKELIEQYKKRAAPIAFIPQPISDEVVPDLQTIMKKYTTDQEKKY